MKKIFKILFFALFTSPSLLMAQLVKLPTSVATLRSQVLEGDGLKPVSFANVLSLKTQKGTICGFDGFFELPLDITDTLVVSSIGFEKEYIIVSKIAKSDGTYYPIRLMTKTYHISTVNIYELRWQKFKDEFRAVEMPKWAGNKYYWLESLFSPEELEEIRKMPLPEPGIAIGLTTTYYQKQLAIIGELEAKDKLEAKISEKFNAQMVAEITGIEDPEELIDFIVYCNFNEYYLLHARTFDIISQVKSYFNQYSQDKKNGKLPDYHPVKKIYTY